MENLGAVEDDLNTWGMVDELRAAKRRVAGTNSAAGIASAAKAKY